MWIPEITHAVIHRNGNFIPDGLDILHASCSLPSSNHRRTWSYRSILLCHLDQAQVALVGGTSVVKVLREHCAKGKVVFAVNLDQLQTYRFLAGVQVERFEDCCSGFSTRQVYISGLTY